MVRPPFFFFALLHFIQPISRVATTMARATTTTTTTPVPRDGESVGNDNNATQD
jgi:hypothetical protein